MKRALLGLALLMILGFVGRFWGADPVGSDAPKAQALELRDAPTDAVRDTHAASRSEIPRAASAKRRTQHTQKLAALRRALKEWEAASKSPAPAGATDLERTPTKTEAKLAQSYIMNAIEEMKPLLLECYTAALEDDPGLGEGKMLVEFEVVGDHELGGVIAESRILEERSELVAPGLNECLRESMYALELPEPEGRGRLKVTYPFQFTQPRDEVPEEAEL